MRLFGPPAAWSINMRGIVSGLYLINANDLPFSSPPTIFSHDIACLQYGSFDYLPFSPSGDLPGRWASQWCAGQVTIWGITVWLCTLYLWGEGLLHLVFVSCLLKHYIAKLIRNEVSYNSNTLSMLVPLPHCLVLDILRRKWIPSFYHIAWSWISWGENGFRPCPMWCCFLWGDVWGQIHLT